MVAERHERLRQLAQISLNGARDRLIFPFEAVFKVELFHFPPVEAHCEQLANFG